MGGWWVLAGVALGGLLTYWATRSEGVREEKRRWRERTGEALGQIHVLLTDSHPDRIQINFKAERSPAEMAEIRSRAVPLRLALSELAFGHPSAEVSQLLL